MIRVLFVCHGNICRSPMAEYYFRRLIEKAGLLESMETASAATTTEEIGNPVYPLAKRELASRGIGCKGKVAVQITPADYNNYDYIVAMDKENIKGIENIFSVHSDEKISLLLDHTDPEDVDHHNRDVSDPWYTRRFDRAWEDITIGCQALFKEILSQHPELAHTEQ